MAISWMLALVWLAIGAAILWYDPPQFRIAIGSGSFSTGWAALVLAAYNLVRWWSYKSAQARRREAQQAPTSTPGRSAGGREPEYNPEFQFDDAPSDKPQA